MAGCALIALALPANAFAVDHFIKVREAFAGTTGAANTDFIELQMFAASQNQVANNLVHVYDSTGLLQDSYAFAANVTGTANNSSLLVSRQDASAFFGPAPDLLDATVEIPFGAGKACYEDVDGATAGIIDCVSWGNFTGNPLGEDGIDNSESRSDDTGTPVPPPGIPDGNAIVRDITGGTNPSLLDAGDDTGDSAADFDVSPLATPRNNAGAVTTTAGAAGVAAGVLEYDAAAGVANRPTAFQAAGVRGIRDTAAPVVAGAGCTQTLTNEVRCTAGAVSSLDLSTGDLADVVMSTTSTDAVIDGGTGNDRITARAGADSLIGGAGGDRLTGGDGEDTIAGQGGNDTVFAADGFVDDINCGGGANDEVFADIDDDIAANCEVVN